MREINNNPGKLNFPKVELKGDTAQPQESPKIEETVKQPVTEDLSLAPSAVIGRSQVQSSITKTSANVEADMKAMIENPAAISKAVDFFEMAFNQLQTKGAEDAYAKAAELTHAFKNEFLN